MFQNNGGRKETLSEREDRRENLNSKITLVFETEMLNSTANEESLPRVGRFFIWRRFVVSAAGDFVYAKFSGINIIIRPSAAIFTVKCNDSVSFSFLFPCFFLR